MVPAALCTSAAGRHIEWKASFLQDLLLHGPYFWQNREYSRLLKNLGVGGADVHGARSLDIIFNHPPNLTTDSCQLDLTSYSFFMLSVLLSESLHAVSSRKEGGIKKIIRKRPYPYGMLPHLLENICMQQTPTAQSLSSAVSSWGCVCHLKGTSYAK